MSMLSTRLIAASAILFIGTAVFAQDWPQWRGPNRDGKAGAFTAPATFPKELTQKWKTTVGLGVATPALVGDKLYVFTRQGDDEVILCLNAADGKEVWKDKYAARAVTGAASRHPGPRSSPAVAEGKVVTFGVGGVLSCYDTAGKLAWRNDTYKDVPTFFTASSPIIVDGVVIAQVGAKATGAIVALELATGKPKWACAGESPAYSSPVVMAVDGVKTIVAMTDAKVIGVAVADGKLLWQVPFAPAGRAQNTATPIIDGTTVIFSGMGRGTKAVTIEKQGDAYAAKDKWTNPKASTQYNTLVLKDGMLYGQSDAGALFCLDAKTGETAWIEAGQRGGFGAIVDAGSVVFSLPSGGELAVLKPDPKAYTEIAKYKTSATPTYATPVISGSRIFVKDQDALILLGL